jgi:outer membrane protein
LWILFLAAQVQAGAPQMNLDEYFQAALQRSEDLASQQELIYQAEEKLSQTKGAILPTVNGNLSYLKQDAPPQGTASSISPQDQTTARIAAVQPLFRGFREFAALRQQKDLLESTQQNRQQATLVLFQDVVQNFYQILTYEKDLGNLTNEIQLNQKRLNELQTYLRIGRSRESEVLTLESNMAALEAQKEVVLGQIESARDVFAFMSGVNRTTGLVDQEPVPGAHEKLDKYLDRIEKRPDVQSLAHSIKASEEGIGIARGGHLPSVDLLGNYYFTRPGFLANVKWDFQIALTVPIFQGGIIQSQVRQASSVWKQSELSLSRARRFARQQIESNFHMYEMDSSQVVKLKKAVDLSQKNYQAELKDYRHGLVTNLDVLSALTASQESQRALDRAQYQLKIDYLKLQASAALRPQKIDDSPNHSSNNSPGNSTGNSPGNSIEELNGVIQMKAE